MTLARETTPDNDEEDQQSPAFSAATLDRHVFKLAIPSVAENLLQTALMIIDTLMISYYGSVPVAAATAAGVILWRTHMVLGSIDRGTTAMVARFSGEGNVDLVSRTVAQATCLALALGTLQSIMGLAFAPWMLAWLGATPEVTEAAVPYIRMIFVASAARMFFFVAAAALRAMGDTRSPMWITLWMNLLHVALNYLLIFGHSGFPELRLFGSGVSTCLSLFMAAGAVAWIMFRGKSLLRVEKRHFLPDRQIARTILRISLPAFLEEIVISVGWLIFFSFIARLGTEVLAAHAIASRIESVSYMAGWGFSVAAATMVGQALGMGSIRLARKAFRRSTRYCVVIMSGIAIVLIMCANQLVGAFHPADDVREIARVLLMIAAIEQPLLGISMTLWGGLRGAGDTVSPMFGSFIGTIIIRIFVVYWLAFTLGFGIYGVYLGTLIDWIVRANLLFFFYHRGRWSRLEIHPRGQLGDAPTPAVSE